MASPSLSFSFCYPSNPKPNASPSPNSSPLHQRQFKSPLAFCPIRRCPLAPLGRNSVPTKPPTRHPCVAQNAASQPVISVSSVKETSEDGSDDAKVSAVLFDMDGVLCNSEDRSRLAAVDVFAELGVKVDTSDFIPFMGTGEANFLGGVARVYGLANFDSAWAKSRFFQIYFEKYATPNSGLGYPGASDLIMKCKERGLKLALASSADRIKVEVNLAAAGLQESYFDAIVSADAFQNLKPAPDIFLAAAKTLGVPSNECVVIEDAVAGVQAAKAAGMRCIAVATTLEEEKLLQEGPSLTRKDIASISLSDILNLKKAAGSEEEMSAGNTSDVQDVLNAEISLPGGLSTTRREILKLGSLVLGFSSIFVAASRWKAMSYMSPKALFNVLFQPNQPSFAKTPDANTSDRVSLFKRYISNLEDRGGGENVPEFQPRLEWLNTTPLRVGQDLKGKVLVLDFWTYCCINCMHLLPDLDYLEKKYKDKPLTVVGVHSAKFDNEKDLEAIRNAVLRYNITHPVVNDGNMIMWRQLGVTSWPTLAVVSPKGKLIGTLIGEGHRQDLDDLIEAALQYYGDKKLLDNRPIPIALEKDKDPRLLSSPLKYPGKIATDLANGRLFISDSNHNRIVVTDLDGNFIQQIGGVNGEGFQDGSFDDASFNRPQGVAYNSSKNVLYVADTENHALREVDFVNEMVRTLAGNGEKGSDYKGGKLGTSQMLNSPWDLCLEPESRSLYIAMAGQHQIWRYSLADGTAQVFSGDGYERNVNGNRGGNTSYAQPSGLSLAKDSREIFVADSESSSIRAMNLQTGGSRLLAGGDPSFSDNLFQFGDKDGIGSEAQFQHPLGLLYDSSGLMYITDSYNHKIKVLDPKTRKVKTVAGTGRAGFKDGSGQFAQLSEPAGLAQGPNGKIFVADTNNSTIRVLEWNGKDEAVISTLVLNDVKPPMPSKPSKQRRLRRRSAVDTEIIRLNPISAQSGDLKIKISLPNGYHFTKEATSKFEVDSETLENVIVDPAAGVISPDGQALLHFSRMTEASTKLQINCKVYYCEEDAVCLYKALAFEVPLDVISSSEISSSKLVPLTYAIKAPSLNGSLSPSSM